VFSCFRAGTNGVCEAGNRLMAVDWEQAFDIIVDRLRQCPDPTTSPVYSPAFRGYDIYLPLLVPDIANERGDRAFQHGGARQDQVRWYLPFYDAAAELCRIGVLRPGERTPMGVAVGPSFNGDGYSLTSFGRSWVASKPESAPRDPARLMAVLHPFAGRLGSGFLERAAEAVGCYRTGHYLATCVMCGAAAESILLAIAIAKVKDDGVVLTDYRSAGGRKRVTDRIGGQLKVGLRDQLETFVRLLGYWRDDAGHGQDSRISEPEANMALLQFLRFAQFADSEWDVLTANPSLTPH
jgi:hypothetical protein